MTASPERAHPSAAQGEHVTLSPRYLGSGMGSGSSGRTPSETRPRGRPIHLVCTSKDGATLLTWGCKGASPHS